MRSRYFTLPEGSGSMIKIKSRIKVRMKNSGFEGLCLATLLIVLPCPSTFGQAGPPPRITNQPQSQIVATGAQVTFTVQAATVTPLSYQWVFNSANLPGGTSASLALTNVQLTQGGTYYVTVVNAAGSVPSTNVTLTVLG